MNTFFPWYHFTPFILYLHSFGGLSLQNQPLRLWKATQVSSMRRMRPRKAGKHWRKLVWVWRGDIWERCAWPPFSTASGKQTPLLSLRSLLITNIVIRQNVGGAFQLCLHCWNKDVVIHQMHANQVGFLHVASGSHINKHAFTVMIDVNIALLHRHSLLIDQTYIRSFIRESEDNFIRNSFASFQTPIAFDFVLYPQSIYYTGAKSEHLFFFFFFFFDLQVLYIAFNGLHIVYRHEEINLVYRMYMLCAMKKSINTGIFFLFIISCSFVCKKQRCEFLCYVLKNM